MLSRLISYNLSALALIRSPSLPLFFSLSLLILHAIGLALVAQLMRAPFWIVGAILSVFILTQFVSRVREIFSPALLAPFWIVYAFVALRFIWLRVLRGEIEGYFDHTLPDLRALLHFEFILVAAMLYSALILFSCLFPPRRRAIRFASILLFSAIFLWAVVEFFGHRTFGATGSDPFAYAQMGIDLAARRTSSHSFPLFPLISSTSLSWYPLLHVGYHLPFNLNGEAITVWPLGGSIAYAIAYRVAGESALYFVNPFFSLLSAFVSGLLAWELMRTESQTVRVAAACLTATLIATSSEIVNWAGVTMVDTQALVFSTLAFYCALRVYRTGKWGWAIGAGIFWGFAYLVRHTQFVIIFGMIPFLLLSPFPKWIRIRNFFLTCLAAFLIALLDLWYHRIYLGDWLTPESEELALFSLNAISQTSAALGSSAFIGSEFGWLLFFIILGIIFYIRREKISSIALLLWLGAALAIHLPYAALRLRDLIPEFPILAFYVSYGVVAAIGALWKKQHVWATLAAAAVIFLGLELSLARMWNTLPRVAQDPRPRFGAMTQQQRASFDTLAQMTPRNAIIGASLNSGAIELYSRRNTFRPAAWCIKGQCNELHEFIEIAQSKNFDIYLLEDHASLTKVLNELRGTYRLERITTLDMPLFGDQKIANAGALWKITR